MRFFLAFLFEEGGPQRGGRSNVGDGSLPLSARPAPIACANQKIPSRHPVFMDIQAKESLVIGIDIQISIARQFIKNSLFRYCKSGKNVV